MNEKGFTLIELIAVIVLLGVLASTVAPKFINLTEAATLAHMQTMVGALKSAETIVSMKIQVRPDNLNTRQNIYTLSTGQNIRVRGKKPDGRWNNTFTHLVEFSDIIQINSNTCSEDDAKWCVRQRGQGWFNNRGYASLRSGRGFIIFPSGNNLNRDECYVYYLNQNNTAVPSIALPTIVGSNFTDC